MPRTNTPVISVSGKQFVNTATSTRFMVRGVALSATSTVTVPLNIDDILANEHHALMTGTIIPQLIALNANCIRVYQVNPAHKHDKTMNDLSKAGIYVMVGLATPKHSIKQMTGEYSYATFAHAAQVVDEFQAYDNTLCFSVGNEVEFPGQQAANIKKANPGFSDKKVSALTVDLELLVAQAMKSFARDIKKHISVNGYRAIPVGADMQDGPQSSWGNDNPYAYQHGLIGTDTIASYYTAGDANEIMDYIGINTYRYVTGGAPADTAYIGLAQEAEVWPVPVILSETGGLGSTPRNWHDVKYLYTTPELYHQLSGQVAFQMLEEGNGHGLYDIGNNNILTATTNGGAADLTTAFATAAGETLYPAKATPVIPTTAPRKVTIPGTKPLTIDIQWPEKLLPAKTYVAPNCTVTISNYASNVVQVVQQGIVLAQVPAMTGTNPTSAQVQVAAGISLVIQANTGTSTAPNWIALCGVVGPAVVSGCTISTNVQWGASAVCNISGEAAVPITVKNYATAEMYVVQNGQVQGTVAGTSVTNGPPVTNTVNVMPGVAILIQGPGWVSVCGVSAQNVKQGITVSNNVPWASGAVCTVN